MNRYAGSLLPNAHASRQKTQEVITKYQSGEIKPKGKKSSKAKSQKMTREAFKVESQESSNIEPVSIGFNKKVAKQWYDARSNTEVSQARRDLNAKLDEYRGHLNSVLVQGDVIGRFRQIQKYIESEAYKSKIKDLDVFELVNAPHMNKNYVEALKYQKIYEAGDKAALPKFAKAAFRTLRDKMLPEEIEARLNFYLTTNKQIVEIMSKVKGFEDASDDKKVAEFFRIYKDAKSKRADNYSSRELMMDMLAGDVNEFIDGDREVNPKLLNEYLELHSADALSVSADIKKERARHVQNPEAKRTSDRIKYLKDPATKLLEIEEITPEEFKMMTSINRPTTGEMVKILSSFNTVGELSDAREVIRLGLSMLGPEDRFMSPYSVESYEIVKQLRERFPNTPPEELQKYWRTRFTSLRNEENLLEALSLKGDS